MAVSCHTAGSGVTCGRPSALTVEIQKSSASSIARRVSSQGVASAPGPLKRLSSSVTGSADTASSLRLYRVDVILAPDSSAAEPGSAGHIPEGLRLRALELEQRLHHLL